MKSDLKKIVWPLGLIFFTVSNSAFAAEYAYVQIKSSKVRSAPKIWASAVASVSYGDSLTVSETNDGWSKVSTSNGKSGFIPSSALSPKKVILASSSRVSQSAADPTDAILAGKGFDQNVESQFAAQSNGNYKAVDTMEKLKVSDSELKAFVVAGELTGGK